MGEGGRTGAGLIYPRFEAIRLASKPAHGNLGRLFSSLESLKGGRIRGCGEALPRTVEGQSPSHFSACWLCSSLIDNDCLSAARGGQQWAGALDLGREGQMWIRSAVDRSMGSQGNPREYVPRWRLRGAALIRRHRRSFQPPGHPGGP